MEKNIESQFGKYYGSTKCVQVHSHQKKGKFTISDQKACNDCKIHTPESEGLCDKVVTFIDAKNETVQIVELESFLDNYHNLKAMESKKRCDLLMYSDDKIVFCDMTCCKPKYVEKYTSGDGEERKGKRMVAREQIEETINLIYAVPKLAADIDCRKEKVALFAYREKTTENLSVFDTNVVERMNSFGLLQKLLTKEKMSSEMSNGFSFKEIRYPDVYEW